MNNRLKINQPITIQTRCLICGDANAQNLIKALHICSGCHADLPWKTAHHCTQCGLPHETLRGSICGQCMQSPPHFNQTIALFDYAFPIDAILQRYKYQDRLTLAHFLRDCFVQQLRTKHSEDTKNIDRIIAMPMHPSRLKSRGFNQALEIARLVSSALNIPLDYQSCVRIKDNPPQASLPLKARVKNVQHAFACEQDLTGQNIVLIDDVMTTGASLNALSQCIKAAGAKHVSCWVIARTLAHSH